MGKLIVRRLALALLISIGLAKPLRGDLDIRLDDGDSVGIDENPKATFIPKVADLPSVDLPYERHKASLPIRFGQNYYNFSNIPYAQQPIKKLRFKKAEPLGKVDGDLPENNGQDTVVCPQEQAGWVPFAEEFLADYLEDNTELAEKWSYPITAKNNYTWSGILSPVPNMNESCLTLDVMVPKRVYDNLKSGGDFEPVPVLVWFFGGGYIFGHKTQFGSPAGLFHESKYADVEGRGDFIYVSANYRLGAFGFLAGKSFEDAGGFENAGLSDQVAALDWVKQNIGLFGGDASEVTIMGQSAGASSILHHLVSYGGDHSPPNTKSPAFKRAILQSPAFFPNLNRSGMEDTYKTFLKEAMVEDFEGLQNAETSDLIRANSKTTYESTYGRFNYGPVKDDSFVQAPPALLLKYDYFWSDRDIMVSYNGAEGLLFTPPWLQNQETLREHILKAYPAFPSYELDYAMELYPIDKEADSKQRVTTSSRLLSDFGVDCNAYGVRKAFPNAYEYHFNLFPGLHGQDLSYTYGPKGGLAVNQVQGRRMRRYITSFVKYGNPNVAKLDKDAEFDIYVNSGEAMTFGKGTSLPINDSFYGMQPDNLNATRCDFWGNAPYWAGPDDVLKNTLLQQQNGDWHQGL